MQLYTRFIVPLLCFSASQLSVAGTPTPPQESLNGSAGEESVATVGSMGPYSTLSLPLVAGPTQAPSSDHALVLDGPAFQLALTPADLCMQEKSVVLGAALSVVPGAGLLYADHPVAGALLMGTFVTGVVGIIGLPAGFGGGDQYEHSFTSTYAPDGTLISQSTTETDIGAPFLGTSLMYGAFVVSSAAVATSVVLSLVTTVPAIQKHNAKVKAIQRITGGQSRQFSFKLNGAGLRGTF